jgi:hypothetical protein
MSDYDPKPFDPTKTPDPEFQAPDIVGHVEGWRAWSVGTKLPPFGVPPKLYSVTHAAYYWTPRRAAQAECICCENSASGVPGEHCTCGFYSAKTLEHLLSMGYHFYDADEMDRFQIVGKVANWGKVVEGTQGWRSQFSYPVALYVPFEAWKLAKALEASYGVPAKLLNVLKQPSEVRLDS